jgi:hypothetical protein
MPFALQELSLLRHSIQTQQFVLEVHVVDKDAQSTWPVKLF